MTSEVNINMYIARIRGKLRNGQWWGPDERLQRLAEVDRFRRRLDKLAADLADEAQVTRRRANEAARAEKHGHEREAWVRSLGLDDDDQRRARALALTVLDLPVNAGDADVDERYRTLIRECHPDARGGDRSREDRYRNVVAAYDVLKRGRVRPSDPP